jgi:tyrosinase
MSVESFSHEPKFKVRAKLTADHLALSSKPVRAVLEPVSEENEKPASLASLVESLPRGKKLYVVFKDFRTNLQPGVLYTAYLNLPEGAKPEVAREHAIGIINFFNATVASDPAQAPKSDRFASFDITDRAKKLSAAGKLRDKPEVTLIPAGAPAADAKPIIGEVTLVEQ